MNIESYKKCSSAISLQGREKSVRKSSIRAQTKITPTSSSHKISQALLNLYEDYEEGGIVRNVGVSAGKVQPALFEQLDLLQPVKKQLNETKIDQVIDDIRRKFGLTSLVKLSSIGDGGTMIDRAGLVGGHNGGNALG